MDLATRRRERRAVRADRSLARYLRRTVYAYSVHYRRLLDASGGSSTGQSGMGELARVPVAEAADLDRLGDYVLRPDAESIARWGSRRLATRLALARLLGNMPRFDRAVIEPGFKPVRWFLAGGVVTGCSQADLRRLGQAGRRWLAEAGVGRRDVLVSLVPGPPGVAHWALMEGARQASVSVADLGVGCDPSLLGRLRPSVVVGEGPELERVLTGWAGAPAPRTVIYLSQPAPPEAAVVARLRALVPAAVVPAWAPPGTRAVWSACRAWTPTGEQPPPLHVWPGVDVCETLDDELVWTGVGWAGTVVLRVRTGARGTVHPGPCPACGHALPVVYASRPPRTRRGMMGAGPKGGM